MKLKRQKPNKKGVDISINTIIVAALALAVLVVLFLIFTGRLGLFSKGVQETTNCAQACKAAGYDDRGACDNDGKNKLVGYYDDTNANLKTACCCK